MIEDAAEPRRVGFMMKATQEKSEMTGNRDDGIIHQVQQGIIGGGK